MREQEIGTPASQGPHQKKENKKVGGVVSVAVWQCVRVAVLPFGSVGSVFGIGNDGKLWHLG